MSSETYVVPFNCLVCGRTYDRDVNAARNIDMEGLRIWRETAAAASP